MIHSGKRLLDKPRHWARLSRLGLVLIGAVLGGCVQSFPALNDSSGTGADTGSAQPATTQITAKPLRLEDFAKSDIDQVAEIHITLIREHLATLMRKLYKRNPRQWRGANKPSAEFVVQRVFRAARVPDFVELGGRRSVDAIRLAFDDSFSGDRVLALISGLTAMVHKAYGEKREFYVLDTLDQQKLYNSARNIELAAWLLRTRTDNKGQLLVLSHSVEEEEINLSFERLFGKIISLQDTLAQIVVGRSNRTIRTVVQRMVGAVFLPI
ncbi:MAG: hypothetical protein ACI9DC_001626 [Gammaproteobacteria bacterium]